MNSEIKIEIASVKVMRSHDYCHFEVCLSSSSANTPELVDELRKTAARLADKAVAQYKVAKTDAYKREAHGTQMESLKHWAEQAKRTPEGERSPSQMAEIKAYEDAKFQERRAEYDYQDDWDQD
jgi:hypothetical protein